MVSNRLEIGKIISEGNLETFVIDRMPVMPIMVNQDIYDEISTTLTPDKLDKIFDGIIGDEIVI
jgi:hypothetical protein